MTSKKVAFFCWGAVYWPFLLLGVLFMGLFELFSGIGGWLHDLLVDWAYPPVPFTGCRDCLMWPDSNCVKCHSQARKETE